MCALAHGDEYVKPGEAADNVVSATERLGEDHDVGVQGVPIGETCCDVLVVVEDRDPHAASQLVFHCAFSC
jgi:hypothetical protein